MQKPFLILVRSINDLHHAQDAYLNIVVGNVYYEKFTNNPLKWLNNENRNNYSLNKMFDYDIRKKDEIVWLSGEEGSIKTVKAMYNKNNILYTRYATCNKGAFFDQQIKGPKDNPSIPLKKGLDLKYGGFKSVTPAYFALVESEDKKGAKQRSIEAVPLYLKKYFETTPQAFVEYCITEYKLKNPIVIIDKIKINSLIIINGYPMYLRGYSDKKILVQNAVQLKVDNETQTYLKRLEKYVNNNKDIKNLTTISEKEKITKEDNLILYDILLQKQGNEIFKKRPASQLKFLMEARTKFIECTLEEECIILNEILHLMQCKAVLANLKLIGGPKEAGRMRFNKVISKKNKSVVLANQSVTGLFEKRIDLLTVQK